MKMISSLFLVIFLGGVALARADEPSRTESLSTLTLHARLANYRIEVPSCATFGERLVSVQVKLAENSRADAYVERVILSYADKQTQVVKVGKQFGAGEQSPWMDLGVHGFHDSRCVAELFLTAKMVARPGQSAPARVQVLGILEKTISGQ